MCCFECMFICRYAYLTVNSTVSLKACSCRLGGQPAARCYPQGLQRLQRSRGEPRPSPHGQHTAMRRMPFGYRRPHRSRRRRSFSKRSFLQPATLTPTDGPVFPHRAAQEGRRGPGRAQRGGSAAPSRRGAPGRCEGRDRGRGRDGERRFGATRRGRGRGGSGTGSGRAKPRRSRRS